MFCFFILPLHYICIYLLHHIYLITLVSRNFADSDYSVWTCNQSDRCGWNAEWVTTDKSSSFYKWILSVGNRTTKKKKTVKNKQKQILIIRKNATFLIWRSAKLMIGRSLLYLLEFFPCESQREPCRNHHSWILSQTQSETLNQIGGLPLLSVPLRYTGCCDRLRPTAQIWNVLFTLLHKVSV